MFGATIEAVGARGYAATSVAELSGLAGVSKRTFYEQFANKEACFLATHDAIVDRVIARVVSAYQSGGNAEAGLRCAVEAFVLAAAEAPKAARLALVETLGAGPAALAHAEAARRKFERILAVAFERTSAGGLPPAIVRGIAYGVEGVVRQSLLGESVGDPAAAAGELAAWALAQGSPAAADLANPAPALGTRAARWPRVRGRTTPGARILRAAAEIATCEGYARLTQLRIAGRAGVSDQEFEDCYESVEACYRAAIDLVCLEALTSTAAASRTAGDGPRGAYRGIAALMSFIAEDPVLRGLIVLDVVAPDGAPAVACRERMLRRFVDLLASRLPVSQRPPCVVAVATVHAVWGIVRHHVVVGAAHRLPELAGEATYMTLAPVVGAEAAVRAILAEERALDAGGRVDGAAA
jgi:AcrR family transcriptional regulator